MSGRVEGIDVSRGVAGLIMIGGHATHAWVDPEGKATLGYAVTRLFATLPLPAFLILAGAAVAWRVDAAARRGEDAATVRRRIVRRGLQIVLWGYVVSGLYALMDGGRGLDTLLRADVLHVIGLSIAGVGWLGIRPGRGTASPAPDPRRLGLAALAVGLAVTLLCPWLTPLTMEVDGPARFLVGLFADVPGVTRMPAVPLAAWMCVGVGAAQWMIARRERSGDRSASGAPTRALLALGGAGLALSVAGWALTPVAVDTFGGGPLTRAHPAVWVNVIDLAGRGLLVLSAGALLAGRVRGAARAILLRLGRGSLVAYVFHIPFCYGVLGAPFADRLPLGTALLATLPLAALSYVAVLARDTLRDKRGLTPSVSLSRPE